MFKIAYSPAYQQTLPEGHRFPMEKYDLIPKQLLHEGVVSETSFFCPEPAAAADILCTHASSYFDQLNNLSLDAAHIRRIGFPLNKQLIEREKILIQGTLECALFALQYGVSLNVAGGTHHAFRDKGEGFCLLNDIGFAANVLLRDQKSKSILIIDLDVHQGNGTASLFNSNSSVFTFSMHGKDNYPFLKEKSDLDVELQNGTNDKTYLDTLEKNLDLAFEKALPDFVFYQCGVDILETDRIGKLAVSENACRQRDEMVFTYCKKNRIPVAGAMGGGYSPKISDIVNAHCQTFKMAQRIFF